MKPHEISSRKLAELVDSAYAANAAGRLERSLTNLKYRALLLVVGDSPVAQSGAILFLQRTNRRFGRALKVITSNKGLEERGRILTFNLMAATPQDGHLPSHGVPSNLYRFLTALRSNT